MTAVSSTNALAPAAAAVPAATATIKRIFFRNNCTCRNTKAYPVIAISYKPVAAADFLTVGYWSLQGCKDRYLIATTHATIGLWGRMEGGTTAWEGDVPLRVYVPAEDKCDARKSFVGYDMPQDWNDYTVVLNCN
uniref:Uncharacterized protein n=1 Tax=Tetradesmus obliquus TaxID=3088 RepID=A0A383V622_TETOB|eukprot:jgi/Sobl393_1/3035/SZX61055.1